MKIKLLSDLHLESDSTNYLPPKISDDKDIVLILAGDICEIDKEYFDNGVKAFTNYKLQTKLFF